MRSKIRIQPRSVYLATYSDVTGWGGALTSAYALAQAIGRRGHSTLVIGVQSGPATCERVPDLVGALNLPARLPGPLWRFRHWLMPALLARALRRLPPPQTAFVAASPFWVIAAKRAWPRVPAYFRLPCLLTNCLPFTWPPGRPRNAWARLDYRAVRRAERLALELADATLVPSAESWEEVTAFVPQAAGRLRRINHGVRDMHRSLDLRERMRRELGLPSGAYLALASGTCDLNKGFDLAIRALANTPPHVHLALIGDGPERAHLDRLARDLRLNERVHLQGARRDVALWSAAADCVLSTSRYDTFPNAILEGMAAARPVLVPEHDPPRVYSGLASLVRRAGAGRCYPRDAGALAAAWNALVRDPPASAALGERGQMYVAENCTWDDCAAFVLGTRAVQNTQAGRPRMPRGASPTASTIQR